MGQPHRQGLPCVSLPYKTCPAVTSGPSNPQNCATHAHEQERHHPTAPGLPMVRETLD